MAWPCYDEMRHQANVIWFAKYAALGEFGAYATLDNQLCRAVGSVLDGVGVQTRSWSSCFRTNAPNAPSAALREVRRRLITPNRAREVREGRGGRHPRGDRPDKGAAAPTVGCTRVDRFRPARFDPDRGRGPRTKRSRGASLFADSTIAKCSKWCGGPSLDSAGVVAN